MNKIEKLDLSILPIVGNGDMITINKHSLSLAFIEAKINELVDRVNEVQKENK